MKTVKIVLFIAFVAMMFGCKKEANPTNENSNWIDRLIVHFENEPVGNPPQSIWQYEYKGDVVYYIPAQCCDMYSILLSSDSTVLCAPDGGLIGTGDGRCVDFFDASTNKKLIWEDMRKE